MNLLKPQILKDHGTRAFEHIAAVQYCPWKKEAMLLNIRGSVYCFQFNRLDASRFAARFLNPKLCEPHTAMSIGKPLEEKHSEPLNKGLNTEKNLIVHVV